MIAGQFLRRCLFGVLALGLFASAAQADDFYKGQTVTIILSSAPGGGCDAVARTLAQHLPKHIPGSPTVVVKNMAGAGGIVAANYLYNVAPKDGLTIGGLHHKMPPRKRGSPPGFDKKPSGWSRYTAPRKPISIRPNSSGSARPATKRRS